MEPLFFKAENQGRLPLASRRHPASMEPLFFKAENAVAHKKSEALACSFNGAAFFQSGKS